MTQGVCGVGLGSRVSRDRGMALFSGDTMNHILAKVQRFLQSEDGPTAVEYAIMLALIIAVCLVAINTVGTEVSSMYDDISADVDSAINKGGFE